VALSLDQLVSYAEGAGFSGDSANTAAAIAMAESGGDPDAINYSDPGGSYGLTQINGAAWGSSAEDTLGDPQEAFDQMFAISNGGTNFSPWSSYNNGSYLPFLNSILGDDSADTGAEGNLLGGTTGGGTAAGLNALSSLNPSSWIGDVESWFETGLYFILGIVLIGIGAFFIAKPKVGETIRSTVSRSAKAAIA
jgi:Lysozyme like domain